MTQMMTSTNAVAHSSGFTEFISFAMAGFDAAGTELLLFFVAILAYFTLFMQRTPKSKLLPKKMVEEDCEDVKCPSNASPKACKVTTEKGEDGENAEKSLQVAFEGGDHRAVLRCWNSMKKFKKQPTVSLPNVVESMQRLKRDTPFILQELSAFLTKYECDMTCVNDLLEALAKRLDSDLMEKIVEMLPSVDLKMDERTYEVFLNMYFTTRSFEEVKTLASQMNAEQIAFTPRSAVTVIKTALKMNNFDDALLYFKESKSSLATGCSSTSTAPVQVVAQMVELACKSHKLSEMIDELSGMSVSEEVVSAMLTECVRQKDVALAQKVEELARTQGASLSGATYGLLIKAMAADQGHIQKLFSEVIDKEVQITPDLVNPMLAFCAQTANFQMAEKLYHNMKSTQLPILSTFIRFFADNGQYTKACEIYEQDLVPLQDGSEGKPPMDARMERSLMNAATKCGRAELAQKLLSSSPSDIAKHITMIRSCAAEKNLQGAIGVFASLEQSGVDLNSVIYNTVLDACVECRDLDAAEAWMEQTKQVGMADVVSFNTLIKAHLQNKNFDKARSLVDELKKEGLQPNRVTYNELINSLAIQGGERQKKQMWDAVGEMTQANVKPNQVTISILLKSLNYYSKQSEITNTMDLINTMEEPMDEVLLSSVVEACVRIGKPELLASQLKQLEGNTAVAITGSHTYGSLIKAYGHSKNIDGVWRCWKQMRSRHITPSSITLGCMVEAIVGNGDADGAFGLIHEIQDDEQCRDALNSVIYCSVLKGFARERKIDRAWEVYEEMNKKRIDVAIVTYNTLIDACARSGRMEYVPRILEDMKTYHVKPNVITYSTMLKGHCQNGDVKTGFAILDEMKNVANLKPDEIMYNSLLDGCAHENRVDEGLKLLEQMQNEGIKPTNFTLSVLVKLMGRARKLDEAFSLVQQITKKYKFQLNVHVYTNLIQSCVSNQQLSRGMTLLEQMINENVAPDNRTYTILVRANISRGFSKEADGLLRGALGLPGALPFLQQSMAVCSNLDTAFVNEALSNLAEYGHAKDLAAPLMECIKERMPRLRIDAATQRTIASPSTSGGPRQSKGKGKGKGKW